MNKMSKKISKQNRREALDETRKMISSIKLKNSSRDIDETMRYLENRNVSIEYKVI